MSKKNNKKEIKIDFEENNQEENEIEENQECTQCNEEKDIDQFLILSRKYKYCKKNKKTKKKESKEDINNLKNKFKNIFNNNQKLINISKKDKIMLLKFLKKKMLV